jgi:CubicO group peptidase (beta-lactamase class C family)|tara:strand:- start:10029 stop:11294 length:1266 start_codon:yes stop_codon:yes gene_type:complete
VKSRRLLFLSIVAALGIAACAGSDDEVVPPAAEPPATEPVPITEPKPDADPVVAEPATSATEPESDPVATESEPDPEPIAYDFAGVDPVVQAFVDDRGLNGAGLVIVDADDGVILERYWGEFGPERSSLIASSSKMLVAGVLLSLQDEGLLDIDAPVADAVDWGSSNPQITPAQLLSNSSGLIGLFPEPGYGPYVCQFLPSGTLQDCAESIFTSPDDDGAITGPDVAFNYGGAQWQVAGAVAEAVSGKSWAELIDETYVQPCGVDSLAFNNHFTQMGEGFNYPVEFNSDPSTLIDTDNPNLEGGAYITAPDYGQLLLMHLRNGLCGDEQVLSQEALDTMHADRIAAAYGGSAGGAGTGYGMGWWIDRESGRISDAGAYGTVPWLDLEDGYGAYLVVESTSGDGNALAGQLYGIVDDAVNAA